MNVFARDVEAGRFFATADKPPNNVFVMRVQPHLPDMQGTCQNINDESYWQIEGSKLVRLIAEDEYEQKVFHV